jgi:putative DNA primase/helicase
MNDAPLEYIAKAISNEAAVVANAQASTRNKILNQSAFRLGTIPGARLDAVVGTLLPAAQTNGYLAEHGEHATRKVIESGFQNGQRNQRKVPRLNRAERRRMAFASGRPASVGSSSTALSSLPDGDAARQTFPPRTQPDKDGKPHFLVVAERPPTAGLDVVCMADVKPTTIEWLWPNWVAVGKVSVLAGEGGHGKSTILCDLASRATTGSRWPDGGTAGPAGGVIILAAEDDVGDTLVPRLMAAGADLARVFVIRSVRDENHRKRGFSIQADLERLEDEIRKRANVRLIIIDPVSSYLGQVDSHKNAEVRAVLEPLGEMAARMRVAVICNNHFSKGGGNANSRVIGSVAFVNQARAAFVVVPDVDDKSRMLLIPSKMNVAPIGHGLAYRIEGCLIRSEGSEIATSRIMYEGTLVTISADQALAAFSGNGERKSEKLEAIQFLKETLKGGPMAVRDVKKEAGDAGISTKSLRSARESLGIKPEKSAFEGGWFWELPKMPSKAEDAHESQRASSGPEGTFGEVGEF